MGLRIKLIQWLIERNEEIFFYPKLYKFYSKYFSSLSQSNYKFGAIVDVGSNKGQSIDFFLKLNSNFQFHCFEPNTKLYNKLIKKYEHSSLIKINNLGISSKNGELMFQENILDETSTFEKINYSSKYLKKKATILGVKTSEIFVSSYPVSVITLSSFLENNQDLFIEALKIDVEGHELDCLKGLFKLKKENYPIRFIQLESHQDDMHIKGDDQQISDLLIEHGFQEVKRIKHGFGDFHEVIYKNVNIE